MFIIIVFTLIFIGPVPVILFLENRRRNVPLHSILAIDIITCMAYFHFSWAFSRYMPTTFALRLIPYPIWLFVSLFIVDRIKKEKDRSKTSDISSRGTGKEG